MKITLKDGSVREYENPMSVLDIARDISEGLARMACVAEIDGEEADLRTVVDKDCHLSILTAKDPGGPFRTPPYGQPCDGPGHQAAVARDQAGHRTRPSPTASTTTLTARTPLTMPRIWRRSRRR